jgi:hypothetical protein
MGGLTRAHDWVATPLGSPESWPQFLRSSLSVCLNSSIPSAIYWGPHRRLLYNDAYAEVTGSVMAERRHTFRLGLEERLRGLASPNE